MQAAGYREADFNNNVPQNEDSFYDDEEEKSDDVDQQEEAKDHRETHNALVNRLESPEGPADNLKAATINHYQEQEVSAFANEQATSLPVNNLNTQIGF